MCGTSTSAGSTARRSPPRSPSRSRSNSARYRAFAWTNRHTSSSPIPTTNAGCGRASSTDARRRSRPRARRRARAAAAARRVRPSVAPPLRVPSAACAPCVCLPLNVSCRSVGRPGPDLNDERSESRHRDPNVAAEPRPVTWPHDLSRLRGDDGRRGPVLPGVRPAPGRLARGAPPRDRADGRPRRLHHASRPAPIPSRSSAWSTTASSALVADIADFGGRLDKIVGDEIVALFGAPIAHEDDAERAVRAALRMQETLAARRRRDRASRCRCASA